MKVLYWGVLIGASLWLTTLASGLTPIDVVEKIKG